MMALATKSPMDSTASLGSNVGYGMVKGRVGDNSMGEDEMNLGQNLNLGLSWNLGALERRIDQDISVSDDVPWEHVDEVLANAGGSGPLDEPDMEDANVVDEATPNFKRGNEEYSGRKLAVHVNFKGDIVGNVKAEPMEVDMSRQQQKNPASVKKEEPQEAIQKQPPKHTTATSRPVQRSASAPSPGKKISLKERRELEAKMFPKEMLQCLEGTTSAEVRKMNSTERDLVLFKRKLRNRQSARRSRVKRQTTLAELQAEVDMIASCVEKVLISAISLKNDNDMLNRQLEVARAELRAWRSIYPEAKPMSQSLKVGV